ncbi:histidine kinase N-terminal 7TM domain-containing diguanylate cyclase [Gorillibacterium timonense]|uniref:histidine kinase N-terminal 7TM domain-containing diguanylate cyclase n=1 Tax=Gorillibacterium timonense TaxID=1689269 RepID=UPI00071DCB1F|nr:diguanylate cyclase [Gorillibacterium timonense]
MSSPAWFDLFLFLLLFGLFVYVFVTVRITNLHKVYFLFHFFMMFWPLCQFATDLTQNPQLQLLFVLLSFVSIPMLASGWLLLTVFLTGYANQFRTRRFLLLFVPAALAAAGVILNPYTLFVNPVEGGYIHRVYGPWFWMMVVILVGYFLASLSFLFRALKSSKTLLTIKKQVRITLWGIYVLAAFAFMDVLLNVVFSPWLPIIPGLTSMGILVSDLFFVFVIKRYKVFDLVSIAHEDVINTIPYGMLVLDENESIIEVNKALRFFIDVSVGDLFDMEKFLASVHVEGSSKEFLDRYKQKENTFSQLEIIAQRESERHYILQVSPIVDSYQMPIGHIITFQDVSQERYLVKELSKANQKLEEMALTDSLTDCFNRRYLTEQLTKEVITNIRNRTPFSLILFDIDYFKAINDRYGHVIGDVVLYRTAQTVKQSIRSSDVLARYGGEEFLIYLPHADRRLAEQLAERVREAIESHRVRVGNESEPISVTVSVGGLTVERFDQEQVSDNLEGSLVQLLADVDKALYQAKQKGRNRVEFADRISWHA